MPSIQAPIELLVVMPCGDRGTEGEIAALRSPRDRGKELFLPGAVKKRNRSISNDMTGKGLAQGCSLNPREKRREKETRGKMRGMSRLMWVYLCKYVIDVAVNCIFMRAIH